MNSALLGARETERPVLIDPLQYPGWDKLLNGNPEGNFFHGTAWARVIHETYGHQPVYFCIFSEGKLKGLLPIMEVSSPVTGRRGVSLPFSDYCPLIDSGKRYQKELFEAALDHGKKRNWKYLECRSTCLEVPNASRSLNFHGHSIELKKDVQTLFAGCESSVQRGIRKAEKAGLKIDFTNTVEAVKLFYRLHCGSRQRHGLPPQPFLFFKNIAQHILAEGKGFVATVRLEDKPIASALFFHEGRLALYKFGASDFAYQQLRPNNFLMWESIKHVASLGFQKLHLGRTSLANEGLRRFKLGFGAREETIAYYKYDFSKETFVSDTDRAENWANNLFRCLPQPILRLAGEILYPHLS